MNRRALIIFGKERPSREQGILFSMCINGELRKVVPHGRNSFGDVMDVY